jgi:N4-gp56 family major capsid protein
MAVFREADGDAIRPDLWAKSLYVQAEKRTFWHRFEGPEGSQMPIIRKDDLEKEVGDNVHFDIVLSLQGEGLTGDTDQGLLDGNEEKLRFRQTSLTTDAFRHGVRWSKLGKIKINHSMRQTGLMQLRKWVANKLDDRIFGELTGYKADGTVYTGQQTATLPDSYQKFVGGDATPTVAEVASGDVIDFDVISDLKALAVNDAEIEPIVAGDDGEEMYGLVVHPYVALGIKKSSEWKQTQREARERGASNPLFRGAIGVYDNVVIYQSRRIPLLTDAGAGSVEVAKNIFFGSQLLMRAYTYYPDWTEQYFSYGEEQGIGTFCVVGEKLITFDLTDAGGAAAADLTAIGGFVVNSEVVAPSEVTSP